MKKTVMGMKAAVKGKRGSVKGINRTAWGKRDIAFCALCFLCTAALSSCQSGPQTAPMPAVPDLVLYTAQEEEIYEPIIKEFEERTNLMVKVERGSSEEMTGRLENEEEKPDWDVVFGVGIETLEQTKEHWQVYKSPEAAFITDSFQCEDNRWTSFSALPLVIMYNTNVVTYRELPVGWNSLLEPRWKGRIAFVDPRRSDVYSAALVTAVHTWEKKGDYLERFMENLEYGTLDSMQEVNAGILDGRYSLGVTMEESAQALLSEGADVDYIYPQEGTTALPDGTAIVKGCANPDAARQFLDFTVSRDTQRILVSDLNRRSVRGDVPPLPGLSPIGRLPLIEMDLEELSREKKDVLARWNSILSRQNAGGGHGMIWYRRLSFKTRVFLGCLLVALVPLTFSSVVMMRLFTASINRQITVDGNQQLEEVRERFTQLLENCQKACETLTEDGSAAWVMIDNKTIEFQKDLYLSMYQAVQEIYSHAQFSIYDAGGKLRFTTDTAPKSSRLPVNWGLLNKASGEQGITYYRTDPYLPSSGSDVLMQGAFSLESIHGARTGYVVLDFTRENFDNLLNGFYSSGDTLLVLDSHQKPLYCSRPEYGEREISDIIGHTISGQGGTEKEGVYTRYLWTREPSQGFYILLRCSAPISAPAVRTMGTVSLALSGLGLVLCLFISGALSRSIGQPVSLLDKAMAKVKKGDLSIRIRTNRQDELGRLTESFNQMTGDLQKYLDDTVQKQKDLNKTTLKLYQTQLNPHFLYNTLDSIKWNARINQVPEIAVLAENLAVILRKSISSRPFITLREELETIESYVEIQKIRFTGRFLYETEIPDQLEDCMVPKMILQPLVENAIIHGLDGCGHGYICIYAFQKEGILNISVTDNGCGMSREMEDWINSEAPAKRDGHLGLYNVINILKIYYGQEYGVKAAVTEDGTTITLRLPVQKEVPDV